MIARLRGRVVETGEGWAVIDVQGVGYHVSCPARVAAQLRGFSGQEVSLAVETVVREDAINLFGFPAAAEREWFRLLLTVQGVGAKAALAILSVADPARLRKAIVAGDPAPIKAAAGVGPKLAGRVVAELKDKAVSMPVGGAAPLEEAQDAPTSAPEPVSGDQSAAAETLPASGDQDQEDAVEEAVSALVNLGYARVDAFTAVTRIAEERPAATPTAQLISLALKELGKALLDGGRTAR
ncbi:MAG: Holliday junction branch migration protein RuvA [Rhodospirillaceae bacterium]